MLKSPEVRATSSIPIRSGRPLTQIFGPLAQLVEQRPFKPCVLGSSPRRLTKNLLTHFVGKPCVLGSPFPIYSGMGVLSQEAHQK